MGLQDSPTVLRQMRDARLKRLGQIGPVLAGSLVEFPKHSSLYLTDKVAGKTRTLYVPLDRLEEVKTWNANHKRAKHLLEELSQIQRRLLLAEIRVSRQLNQKGSSKRSSRRSSTSSLS